MHTWLAWLVRVIWSAARRILGIPQAIDQAEYCLFVICRNSKLTEFLELIPGSLSGECNYLALPALPGFRSPFRREYAKRGLQFSAD